MIANPFLRDVYREVQRARKKFPAPNLNFAALGEEFGEVSRALMSESSERVYAECVQVAAMAMRVALEGDISFDTYRAEKGLDEHPNS